MKLFSNLYQHENFKLFSFKENWQTICSEMNVDGVRSNNYLLLSEIPRQKNYVISEYKRILRIEAKHIDINPELNFQRHGIITARLKKEEIIQADSYPYHYYQFFYQVLRHQYQWVKLFFECVHQFLSKRISGGRIITQNDAVQNILSEIIEDLSLVNALCESKKNITKEQMSAVSVLLIRSAKNIAACAGGRGFTGGNVLELLWFIQMLNQFMLGDG